jgi:hypothetical protein
MALRAALTWTDQAVAKVTFASVALALIVSTPLRALHERGWPGPGTRIRQLVTAPPRVVLPRRLV